jgi:hypothetical protein
MKKMKVIALVLVMFLTMQQVAHAWVVGHLLEKILQFTSERQVGEEPGGGHG